MPSSRAAIVAVTGENDDVLPFFRSKFPEKIEKEFCGAAAGGEHQGIRVGAAGGEMRFFQCAHGTGGGNGIHIFSAGK